MKTMINIKADKEVKESAQEVARELGMPLSTVINAFLKDFIRSRSIAFSATPQMTPYLEEVLGVVEKDIKKGKKLSPVLFTSEDVSDYLDSL